MHACVRVLPVLEASGGGRDGGVGRAQQVNGSKRTISLRTLLVELLPSSMHAAGATAAAAAAVRKEELEGAQAEVKVRTAASLASESEVVVPSLFSVRKVF